MLRDAGYTRTLLNDRKVMSTLVLPVNAAFGAPLEANAYGRNMSEVISERPDIVNSLVGVSVWKGLWTSDTFSRRGTAIPTSNKMGSEGAPMTVEAFSGRGGLTVEAEGSEATVLVSDLAACGPSVVHIVDSFLLPFDWDDDARDRTQLGFGEGGQGGQGGQGGEAVGNVGAGSDGKADEDGAKANGEGASGSGAKPASGPSGNVPSQDAAPNLIDF